MERIIKKLITIILLIPICLNAQIEFADDYSFQTDKKIHVGTAIVISGSVFMAVNKKTNDVDLAFNASWMASGFAALIKEGKVIINKC